MLRAFREKDVRIDLEIKKALDHSNELAEKGASNVQARSLLGRRNDPSEK